MRTRAHAPSEDGFTDEKEEFYKLLESHLSQVAGGAVKAVLVDLNRRRSSLFPTIKKCGLHTSIKRQRNANRKFRVQQSPGRLQGLFSTQNKTFGHVEISGWDRGKPDRSHTQR